MFVLYKFLTKTKKNCPVFIKLNIKICFIQVFLYHHKKAFSKNMMLNYLTMKKKLRFLGMVENKKIGHSNFRSHTFVSILFYKTGYTSKNSYIFIY